LPAEAEGKIRVFSCHFTGNPSSRLQINNSNSFLAFITGISSNVVLIELRRFSPSTPSLYAISPAAWLTSRVWCRLWVIQVPGQDAAAGGLIRSVWPFGNAFVYRKYTTTCI
jgi:hypothetical protein